MTGLPDRDAFVARFGGIFEHSAWVAETAFDHNPSVAHAGHEDLHAAMVAAMRAAPRASQLALINAHPDLAGRLAAAGKLTGDSTAEQKSAGLDLLTDAERDRLWN